MEQIIQTPIQTGKSFILIDTNIIRVNQSWEKDYSEINFKGNFYSLIKYIEENELQDMISIGITQVSLDEFFKSKKTNFKNAFDTFVPKIDLFKNMEVCDFSSVKIPDDSFKYEDYISKKVIDFIKSKNYIKVLDLDFSKSEEVLKKLYVKVFEGRKPFSISSTGSDKGFKDCLIWETFIQSEIQEEFDYFYLLTENDSDFTSELETEFEEKKEKNLTIFYTIEDLFKKLNSYYHLFEKYPEIVKYMRDQYYKKEISNLLGSFLNEKISDTDVEIIDWGNGIEEFNNNNYLYFEGEDLNAGYKVLYTRLKYNNKCYEIRILFEEFAKEIITSNIDEIEEVENGN